MELARAIFLVMEVGLRLAEEVIDANVASDVKRLLTGLTFFRITFLTSSYCSRILSMKQRV